MGCRVGDPFMRRFSRQKLLLITVDLLASVVATLMAFLVRFALEGAAIPPVFLKNFLKSLPLVLPLRGLLYSGMGLYRVLWSHAGAPEMLRLFGIVAMETAVTSAVTYVLADGRYPRSVFIIGGLLNVALLGSVRLLLKLRHQLNRLRRAQHAQNRRVLIFGAGDAGALLARELIRHPELGFFVVGFLDDDVAKLGFQVAGKPVLGVRQELGEVAARYGATDLIVAVPQLNPRTLRELLDEGRKLGLKVRVLPSVYELVDGKVSISQVRDVQIEDLLGREEVKLDLEAVARYLTGEVVLITGAGGSIGSELCRQVARFSPQQLVLLGHGENSIYEIGLELQETFPNLEIHRVIADIKDAQRIDAVFARFRPGVVFHAAAHKHVPLMEENPEEAIKNNVFGTLNVAEAAVRHGTKRFVLVSTDKAVNPISVMGATKRMAEYIIQCLSRTADTIFVAVRFGNVLGSRGSVIPLFQRQIAAGGPVTVTDPRMVRYFMTIQEAAQLIIQAGSMGKGGEIFVLDMGKPVRIIDLARDLIRLSGFEPGRDIPIKITGPRQGERLVEVLIGDDEHPSPTEHKRIVRIDPPPRDVLGLNRLLDELRAILDSDNVHREQVIRLALELPTTAGAAKRHHVG